MVDKRDLSWFRNAIAILYDATVTQYCDSALKVTEVNSNFSSQTVRELRALAKERCFCGYSKLRKAELVVLLENTEMRRAARGGYINLVKLCRKRGATDFDEAMVCAAHGGHIEIVKLCREYGATAFDEAMVWAAHGGHIEIVKLCREYGATAFSEAMRSAACEGHVDVVELCGELGGAINCGEVMVIAARRGHIGIVELCRKSLNDRATRSRPREQ